MFRQTATTPAGALGTISSTWQGRTFGKSLHQKYKCCNDKNRNESEIVESIAEQCWDRTVTRSNCNCITQLFGTQSVVGLVDNGDRIVDEVLLNQNNKNHTNTHMCARTQVQTATTLPDSNESAGVKVQVAETFAEQCLDSVKSLFFLCYF